ncbi:DUF222 domain-containing protein [Marisediminicola sp. LYQ85]|uniref:HNH endonuclease n=1 Tax=Marisediminicola sp. LYQ85 TaxID=3391062 RepID=UPI0039837CB4
MKFEELTVQREVSPSDDSHMLHVELDPALAEIERGDALLDDLQLVHRDEARLAANRFTRVDEFRRHRELSLAAARDRSGMFGRALRAEVAAALSLPERTAETLMARARALVDDLPTTLARLRDGRFSERHAVIIADESMTLDAAERAEFEAQVLPLAERMRAGLFEKKARQIRELVHGAGLAERHETARERREVLIEPGRDGMGWLSAHLPNEALFAIDNRITAAGRSLQVDDEDRTLTQLKADVLVDALTDEGALLAPGDPETGLRSPTVLRGIRSEVSIVVPALTVMGKAATPGMLEGVTPIDPETARELAASATGFTRILTHPETGVVLSFGKDRYTVPSELKRYLRYRDETCRFIGCSRRARFCDIDHTIPWNGDGLTVHDNLAHLCRGHHKTKDAGWGVTQARDGSGSLTWTSPMGRAYATEAVHPIGGRAGP